MSTLNEKDLELDAILSEFREAETPAPETKPKAETAPTPQVKAPEPQPERPKPKPVRPEPRPEQPEAPAKGGPFPVLGLLLLAVLALLSLAWAAVNLHPDSGRTEIKPERSSMDLSQQLDARLENVAIEALSDIVYIRKRYVIPENSLTAPRPDPACFGETTDPAVVQAVVDQASELLEGQELIWNPDIEFMPNTTMRYYYDETILVITWKEVIEKGTVTFAEVKIADGSQLRRALAGNSYGSGVRKKATTMAEEANAVIAINGDFYDYRQLGITVYQRQLYRNKPQNVDSCFFTASGDMLMSHRGELTGEGEAQRFIEDNDVVFAVAFGPILVENGERIVTDSYPVGEVNTLYSRAAIGLKDKLHYLLMTVGQEGHYYQRCTINQAAINMYNKGVISAYALDGGQTATIAMQGTTVNRVDWDEERTMSDIIYFATALPEKEG